MKILIINDFFAKIVAGGEIYSYNLAKLLSERGHKIKLFGCDKNKEDFGSFFSRWFSLKYYFKTKKIIKEFKPDIIHANSVSRIISPSPLLTAKRQNIPVVMTVHSFCYVCPKGWFIYKDKKPCKFGFGIRCLFSNCYVTKRGGKYWIYHFLRILKIYLHRWLIKKWVDLFICPSRILAAWQKKSLNINNITYLPNFIRIEKKEISNVNIEKSKQVLFVGRLSKEKGIDVLIKATKIAKESCPEISVKIIGDGPERKNLEELVRKLNLEKNIKFLGKIPNEKIFLYYQKSLAVIMPSVCMENCPIVAFEAMANKAPIIASNIGGIPEIVQNEKTGLLFTPGDPKDLASKIIKLLKNQNLANRLGKKGEIFFKKNLSSKNHLEKLEQIYNSLILAHSKE